MKHRNKIIVLLMILGLTLMAADETFKVLFIGNSYTGGIKGELNKFLSMSPYKGSKFEYINPGGKRLSQHLANPKVAERINATVDDGNRITDFLYRD